MTFVPNLRFPEFDGDWEKKRLKEVAEIARGKSKHRPRDAEFLFGGEYPFIQTGDIRKAGLFLTEFSQTYSEQGLKQSKLWDEGTLCITIAANIAETAILKIKACFPDSIIGLTSHKNKATILFIKYSFDKFKSSIRKLSQGVAQDNLNQEKLSNIKFYFPTIIEQNKVSSFLLLLDTLIQTQKKMIEELITLKKGLAQKIFSQELRFKDDGGNNYPLWEKKTLDDVCEIKKGVQLNKEELNEVGMYPCLNGGVSPSGYSDKYNTDKNTITISEGGNSCGFVNFMTTKFWLGGHCYKILLSCDTHLLYFYQLLKFNEKQIMNLRVGSGLPNIQMKDLKRYKIKMSKSLPEQQKIANVLSSIDEKIEVENQLLQKMEEQKKYFLANLFI